MIEPQSKSKGIAYPNLDGQIKAMGKYPAVFKEKMKYDFFICPQSGFVTISFVHFLGYILDVLVGGVHDYETIFRYLYNALPPLFIKSN